MTLFLSCKIINQNEILLHQLLGTPWKIHYYIREKSLNWMKNKERETSCFISAKEQNYHAQRPESILRELVLERESQLPYLSYDEHVAEELRGCSLTVFSSDYFIFFFFFFWLSGLLGCSKGT